MSVRLPRKFPPLDLATRPPKESEESDLSSLESISSFSGDETEAHSLAVKKVVKKAVKETLDDRIAKSILRGGCSEQPPQPLSSEQPPQPLSSEQLPQLLSEEEAGGGLQITMEAVSGRTNASGNLKRLLSAKKIGEGTPDDRVSKSFSRSGVSEQPRESLSESRQEALSEEVSRRLQIAREVLSAREVVSEPTNPPYDEVVIGRLGEDEVVIGRLEEEGRVFELDEDRLKEPWKVVKK